MIDAHAHLWLKQNGVVDGLPVYDVGGGRSQFGREIRQMLPPAMTDGVNSAERLLSNMDFSCIGGAVVTQEYIDGNQDAYLREVRQNFPNRFRVTCLYEENGLPETVEDYFKFLVREHIFLDKRNKRIQEYCIERGLL